jgi:hypothetical protein
MCKQKGCGKRDLQEAENKGIGEWRVASDEKKPRGYPHPGCFAQRVRKVLKTKDASAKKRGKRVQEAASY